MIINFQRTWVRVLWGVAVVIVCALFAGTVLRRFAIAVVADPRLEINQEMLEASVLRFPDSAALHARLAARLIEAGVSATESHEELARRAILHATRATQLLPRGYEPRLLLSAAHELTGDLAQAETELQAALALAPEHAALHWRLANLLVREEKLAPALPEFRRATRADASLLPATLSTLWQLTDGNQELVASIVGSDLRAQLLYARFLVEQKQASSAIALVTRLERNALQEAIATRSLLEVLLAAGEYGAADQVWQHLFGARADKAWLWNGGFEAERRKEFAYFNWQLSDSRYARVELAQAPARTGNYSLGLAYQGIETTRLEGEIRQLIVVRPGTRYHLEGYAKADALVTPDGPRLVVTKVNDAASVAETATVAPGSHDWQWLAVDFVAPAETHALLITIKQTPRFSYAEPTRGTVWFDDLSVTER